MTLSPMMEKSIQQTTCMTQLRRVTLGSFNIDKKIVSVHLGDKEVKLDDKVIITDVGSPR